MNRALLLACLLASASLGSEPAEPVPTTTLHNVLKLDAALYSGSSPETEEGFRELAQLGIRTIISVDGAKPRLELAHRFGMRYVHLPIGYDGVPKSRGGELVRAAQTAEGPIYVHCHHGKHRGPAAAATICRARDGWDAERADAFLQKAGTAPEYAGLFRDVRDFQPPTAAELARLPASFPEASEPGELVDAMVAIDEHFDALKATQKAGWRGPDGTASTPAAVLVWEQLRELARTGDTASRQPNYRAKLMEAMEAADALRQILGTPSPDPARCDAAFRRFAETCAGCHKAHRN